MRRIKRDAVSLVNFIMSKEALTLAELAGRISFFFLFPRASLATRFFFYYSFPFFCRVKSHQSAGNHMLIHTNEELLQTQVLIINDT